MTREEAIEVYNGLINTKIKEAFEFFAPELRESEDERIRKELVSLVKEGGCITSKKDIELALAYLEKQKEPIDPFDTKLFQDGVKEGRRLEREDIKKEPIPIPDKFCGLQSLLLQYLQSAANRTDDAEIESDTDLWGRKILHYVWKYSEKQKEQKPADNQFPPLAGLDAIKAKYYDAGFKNGFDEGIDSVKPAECGCTNVESEYDKGYRDGIDFQLKQTAQYSIGKTFMGLIPCWVNAPSTLQPAHKYHGKNAVIMHESNGGFCCCFIDNEKAATVYLPENTGFVEGWRKKPVEWSDEDEKTRRNLISLLANMRGDRITEETYQKYYPWLKDLRPSWKPSEGQPQVAGVGKMEPEVDLERDAVQFCFDKGLNVTPYQAKTIARHFFELGLKARKEE